MADDADQLAVVARPHGARPERRGERVVDQPGVLAVRRYRRGGVVAAVGALLDGHRRRERRAARAGRGEQHLLVLEPGAAVHPAQDDPVRGVRPVGRPVGDVHRRRRRQVAARPADAVLDAAADRRLDVVARVERREQVHGPAEVRSAVVGGDHLDLARRSARGAGGELVDEHVDLAVGVGPDRATRAAEAVAAAGVVRRGRDLLLRPARPAVARGEHVQRLVGGALAVAAEGGVAQVDVAEVRAAGRVVGPDLLLVGEQRTRLVAGDGRCAPGRAARRRCARPRWPRRP